MKARLFLCFASFTLLLDSLQLQAAVPLATTDSVSNVSSNAATLHGTVTPRAANTRAYFQWGLTTSYGNLTATQILSGSVAVPVQQSIAGLAPLTTYHFRTVARNAFGVRYGTNFPFTTAGFPPAVTTENATGITTNSATLRGTINPNGLDTTAYFEWGTTTSYGMTTAAQTLGAGTAEVPVQASLSNLVTDTPYHYRLVASNAAGIAYGNDVIVTPTLLLYLYAGESWTYEFHDLPFTGYSGIGSHFGEMRCYLGLLGGSLAPASQLRFEIGDSDLAYSIIVTNGSPSPALNSAFGGYWVDGQGAVRLTMLSGSAVIAQITFEQIGQREPLLGYPRWANTIRPTKFPQPPAFGTQFVSSVSFRSAVVSADIDTRNIASGVFVEWGSTTNYGSATGSLPLDLDYFVRRDITVSNLVPGAVYHLRVVATNSAGVTYGKDLTLTTPVPVVTLPASNRKAASATVNASVTVNGVATSGYFEWGLTTNYGQLTPVQNLGSAMAATNFSALITGLIPQTTYHCRTIVYSGGITNHGDDVAFSTTPTSTNLVVTNLATDDVLDAITRGGTISFACDGVIVLSNQVEIANDLILDASGHSITFSGSNATRIFKVFPDTTFSLTNLDLVNGRDTNAGGAIYNEGIVFAHDCRFLSNSVIGIAGANGTNGTTGINGSFTTPPGPGGPGGPGDRGGNAHGGAIANYGAVTLSHCFFATNVAVGGAGGTGGAGGRGGNESPGFRPGREGGVGGAGGSGGTARGAAIANYGALSLMGCTFSNSLLIAGAGGRGGQGGYYGCCVALLWAGGPGGQGGHAYGSAVSGTATVLASNCVFVANRALGGTAGLGGGGLVGPIPKGENGGTGEGGGIYSETNCVVINSTFVTNFCAGGDSPQAYGGDGSGGAIANRGLCQLINVTMSDNIARGGSGVTNGNAFGGSIFNTGSLQIVNSILDQGSSNNLYGAVIDLGHNISSDATPAWTSGTSLNNTDPLLLPLANNGGPTPTMALGAGSPALNNADCATAPATDQRGIPRPGGPGCDIGAYEEGAVALRLAITRESSSTNVLRWVAESGRSYRIEESLNLSGWTALATNIATTNGWLEFRVPVETSRFFRLLAQ